MWSTVDDVAKHVGTRSVDEIWLLPNAQFGVIENGSLITKLRDKGQRILALGIAAVEGMDTGAFKAILAHEFGHFHNRDMPGGDISMRVNASMNGFVESILQRGKIRWWDVAVRFLSVYYRMFTRMTFGASQMQEIMADRIAVKAFGATAFERGLNHATRRTYESAFEQQHQMDRLLFGETLKMEPDDLFSPDERMRICEAIELENKSGTTEYDTHPTPLQRFTYTKLFEEQGKDPGNQTLVWCLFDEPKQIKKEMKCLVDEAIKSQIKLQGQLNAQNLPLFAQAFNESKDPNWMVESASLRVEAGEFAEAINDLDMAIKAAKSVADQIQVRIFKVNLLLKIGQHMEALECLLSIPVEDVPDDLLSGFYELLSFTYECNGDFENAEQALTKTNGLEPDCYVTEFRGARIQQNLGNCEKAIKRFELASQLCALAPEPHYYRGMLLQKLGLHDQAEQAFQKCLSLDSQITKARTALNDVKAS